MQLKTMILAGALTLTSSFALAQGVVLGGAPMSREADTGQGAEINSAPDARPPGVNRHYSHRTFGYAPSRRFYRTAPEWAAPGFDETAPAGY